MRKQVETEISYLKELLRKVKSNEEDERILHVSKQGNNYYYYVLTNEDNKLKKKYLPKSQIQLARLLAQKSYNEKVYQLIQQKIKVYDRFLKELDKDIKDLYSNLPTGRKQLVTPIIENDEEYIVNWLEKKKNQKLLNQNMYSMSYEYYTEKGERVRSKSEKIIADKLYLKGIPYIYECPFKLGKQIVYPDFTILDIKRRKEKYIEHLGMMDIAEYAESAVKKVNIYEKNGIMIGRDLYISMETQGVPLDTTYIDRMLKSILE